MVVVFLLNGERLVHLKLAQLVLSLLIEQAANSRAGGRCHGWLLASTVKVRAGTLLHAHTSLIHEGDWRGPLRLGHLWHDSVRRSYAVKSDQANLILNVKLVLMILMKDHL